MFKILDAYMRPNGIYIMTNPYLYRVYKNPEARDLFIKAQWAETVDERIDLFKKMGEYKYVDETPKKSIFKTCRGIFKQTIKTLKEWYFPKRITK